MQTSSPHRNADLAESQIPRSSFHICTEVRHTSMQSPTCWNCTTDHTATMTHTIWLQNAASSFRVERWFEIRRLDTRDQFFTASIWKIVRIKYEPPTAVWKVLWDQRRPYSSLKDSPNWISTPQKDLKHRNAILAGTQPFSTAFHSCTTVRDTYLLLSTCCTTTDKCTHPSCQK